MGEAVLTGVRRFGVAALACLLTGVLNAGAAWAEGVAPSALPEADDAPVGVTGLDRYVGREDEAFSWELAEEVDEGMVITSMLRVVSQEWRAQPEVSHPRWTHWVRVVRPKTRQLGTALLLIDGGTRQENRPRVTDTLLSQLSLQTGAVVVHVPNVPNQPTELVGDGKQRYEDDMIAETWLKFLDSGDEEWVLQLPMVKSAVAAMDAAEGFLAGIEGFGAPDDFLVTGASKRGWTTWLTAAVDDRVKGIIPIVIDTLNLPKMIGHHWAAYGFWAPAIRAYSSRDLGRLAATPEQIRPLRELVDPYLYRERLDMPKFILNASGDQYFLPDTARYWLDGLPGETRLRYVPNAAHDVADNPGAVISAVAFFLAVAQDKELPDLAWEHADSGVLRVKPEIPSGGAPISLTLWTATNPQGRDFRVEKIGKVWSSAALSVGADGWAEASVPEPERGFTAYFVEASMPIEGVLFPATFTTPVFVTPDVLPFSDVPME